MFHREVELGGVSRSGVWYLSAPAGERILPQVFFAVFHREVELGEVSATTGNNINGSAHGHVAANAADVVAPAGLNGKFLDPVVDIHSALSRFSRLMSQRPGDGDTATREAGTVAAASTMTGHVERLFRLKESAVRLCSEIGFQSGRQTFCSLTPV